MEDAREGVTPEALEELYRLRFRAFLRVAAGVAGERHAADAVRNGFVRALRHRQTFREGGSLEVWVWRIVVNSAHDLRRAHGGELLLEALPPRQRLAVFLRYYADLDYEAIAEILDVTPGRVAATLHKAHDTVRRRLQEDARCMAS